MQSLATFTFFATTQLDSDQVSLRRARTKRWVGHGNPIGSLILSCHGVRGLIRAKPLCAALDQTPTGTGRSDSKVVRFHDVGRGRNEGVEIELAPRGKLDTRALVRRLHDARTADDVEELLNDVEDIPLPVCSTLIRGFGVDNRLDAAFAVVEWLKRRKGHDGPNMFIYNSLLSAVKQTRQFGRVDEVLEGMEAQGIAPNIVTYNTLMSIYLEQGRFSEAINVLENIKMHGLSPSPVTYSTTLLAYKKMDDVGGAIRYFVKMRDAYEKGEIGKDEGAEWKVEFVKFEKFVIQTCCIAVRRHLVKDENPAVEVFKLFSDMDRARLRPDRKEYERLAWACTRETHYEVARELYRRIRETDGEISLSVCNHVIWVMGKAKKWWAALEIYEDLLDKGPKPNNLSYELIVSHFNFLLSAARRKGIWRWGVRLLNKMQDKGLRPGTREWNAVLVACSKASETSAAVQIFKRMVEQGEKPTVLSYGALLSALEKGKLYDEALKVWEHMCKVGVKPNLYAYTILASIYAGQARSEMVDSVLREMISSGIEPTVVTYNAIITGCARNQMGSAAFEWFHRMKVQNIEPNKITYDMLVEALARDGKPRLALEMYLKAHTEGMNLSSRSYDAVMESCRTNGTGIDINALGPRPQEKKRTVKVRKILSDFCNLADLPRRSKPFDMTEIYDSHTQERS